MGVFRPLSQTKFINDANLVSYWKLDGNSNDSKGSNNGTDTNISYVSGNFDNSASFNGSSSYINTPWLVTSTGSISCWIKTSSSSLSDIWGNETTGQYHRLILETSGKLTFDCFTSGATQYTLTSNATVNNNVFHHVVCVWGTGGAKIYIDGKLENSSTNTSYGNSSTGLQIGVNNNNGSRTWWFNGIEDDISAFSRALSAGEVAELYQSMTLGEYLPNSSTKLLLHLNGSSADSSGNNNNGTDTNITYSQANGKFGQGAGFNGSTSKIALPNNSSFNFGTNGLTILSWIKTSVTGTQKNIFQRQDDGNSHNPIIEFGINTSNQLFGQVRGQTNTSGLMSTNTTTTITDGNWHLVGLVFNDSTDTGYLFIDGTIGATQTGVTTTTIDFSSAIPSIGRYYQGWISTEGGFFNGSIDEVMVENRAWSASEVKKYYANSKGYWATL